MPEVTDPVCGRRLEAERAVATSEHAGRTWYFHAPECKRVFDASPDAWTGPGHAELESSGPRGSADAPFPAPKFGAAGGGGAEYGPGAEPE